MSPTDIAKSIWVKRQMASLLYRRRRQLDGHPKVQDAISQRIGVLHRQVSEMERKLDRLAVVDAE